MPDPSMDDRTDDQTDRRTDGNDDEDDDQSLDERLVVVLSVAVFATPALITALRLYVAVPVRAVRVTPLLIVVAIGIYWYLTRTEDDERTDALDGETTGSADGVTSEADADGAASGAEAQPDCTADSRGPDDALERPETGDTRRARSPELASINYEMVSQQAMYRDQLLIRANYFSIAVVAVLVNIFLRTSPHFRPAVAMIGAATAYAFWLATESYKGTRDELNGELRRLEGSHSDLSVVEVYDTRERSPVGKRSLSSYFVGIQIATTLLWTMVYFGYTGYLTYI